MQLHLNLGLRGKFFVAMFSTVLLLGLAMLAVVNTSVRSRLILTLQQQGALIAQQIAANAVDPVLTEKYFQLKLMLHQLKSSDADIVYIFVLDPSGNVLAHTFTGGFPTELLPANRFSPDDGRTSTRELFTEQGKIIDTAAPLLQGTLGEVRIGLSEARVGKDVDAIIRLLVWMIIGVLVVGSAAVTIFDLIMTRPILTLVEAVRAVERGEMDKRANLRSSDEIGILGQAFDRMIEKRGQVEKEKEGLIDELQQALAEIKTLKGIIPICASCKKIRDDRGYWNQIEQFIRKHTRADLSHGICPDCASKLYPEFYKKNPDQ
ncbi:HAMP domain-containing protein [Desulfurivibrio sp. D14AmB]|uniref:HAMP domain-containing protein n=1 Tax=Desulfurivibrio sp. D14AmB TaxID=3374370 RepID=UPI00376EC6CD